MRVIHSLSVAFVLYFAVAPGSSRAQGVKVISGEMDSDGFPISNARVCLNGPLYTCYPMGSITQKDVTYSFGLDPQALAIAPPGPGPWLLFAATFSGGGSGILTRYQIIRSEGTYLVGVLGNVALTEQGDHAVWHEQPVSPFPLFITADYLWSQKETHFARHFYIVHAYRYDPAEREYFVILTYKTTRKYRSLDETDKIAVITPERNKILRGLRAAKPLLPVP